MCFFVVVVVKKKIKNLSGGGNGTWNGTQKSRFGSVQWREKQNKNAEGNFFYCACLRLYHLLSYSISPELAATALLYSV